MSKLKNEIGNHYGKLTVIERAPNNSTGNAMWRCLCECGNETIASGTDLRRGHYQSCGCHSFEARHKDTLVGEKFGLLTVLSRDEEYEAKKYNGHHSLSYWKCQCECGSISTHSYNSLMNGTSSCGCITSKGETKITKILIEHNIPFEKQKSFNTCRYPNTGAMARFDFYINNSFLLEFDGEYHFTYGRGSWDTKEYYDTIVYRDNFKNQWCKDNNIILKRIPYWHFKYLSLQDILGDRFIVNNNNTINGELIDV